MCWFAKIDRVFVLAMSRAWRATYGFWQVVVGKVEALTYLDHPVPMRIGGRSYAPSRRRLIKLSEARRMKGQVYRSMVDAILKLLMALREL